MKFNYRELLNIVKRRVQLFLQGDRTGVAIWWISRFMPVFPNLIGLKFKGYAFDGDHIGASIGETNKLISRITSENSPEVWNAGMNLATFLLDYVQKTQPKVIFETGVANGVTTLVIQQGISSAATVFHSVDTNKSCAYVNKSSPNWYFHHLEGRNLKRKLSQITETLPEIDLWVHDSDHHYIWQSFEYALAIRKLRPGGILVSDDVDFSRAWSELVVSNQIEYICTVIDGRKCFGIAQKKN